MGISDDETALTYNSRETVLGISSQQLIGCYTFII